MKYKIPGIQATQTTHAKIKNIATGIKICFDKTYEPCEAQEK